MSSTPKSPILLAASALALGTTLIGCTLDGGKQVNVAARASSTLDKASQEAADAATTALAKGEVDKAVALAERAVGFSPRDAGYRSLLANAYLRAGRFSSAEASFAEVMLLNPSDGRAALSRALTQIALGDRQGALSTLQASNGQIAAADYGLALALAGDPAAALNVLQPAAREAGADGRVRQNLALAHALAGQWEQARVIAAQDVPGDELPARMAAWADFARPDKTGGQVPTLLGVAPAQDPGRPERLALIVEPAQPEVAVAEAATVKAEPPVAAPDLAEAPAPALAQAEVVEAPLAEAPVVAAPVIEAPTMETALAEVRTIAKAPARRAAPTPELVRAALAPRPSARAFAAPRIMTGRYVVQLGAFSSKAGAERAWAGAIRRYGRLGGFQPSSTGFSIRGGTLHRLSVSGFSTQREAQGLCQQYRLQGGSCFVRTLAGDQPMRWAGRQTRNG